LEKPPTKKKTGITWNSQVPSHSPEVRADGAGRRVDVAFEVVDRDEPMAEHDRDDRRRTQEVDVAIAGAGGWPSPARSSRELTARWYAPAVAGQGRRGKMSANVRRLSLSPLAPDANEGLCRAP
jgi:hypothetical protein